MMDNTYYVTRSGGRWAHLNWHRDYTPSSAEERAITLVARIPGCTLKRERFTLSIPRTAWMLEPVQRLEEVVGVGLVTDSAPADCELVEPPCRSPYEHQWDAVRLAVSSGALLLADDMGLGKTTTALVAAKNAVPDGPKLIIAPLFTRGVWKRELEALGYLGGDAERWARAGNDLALFHDERFDEMSNVGWQALEGRKTSASAFDWHAEWTFCHYDIVEAWWSLIGMRNPKAVIIDEAHWAKNGRSKRGKGASMALGPAPFRMLLTGTPMENRPSELWHLLTMTTGTGTWGTPTEFRIRYCGAFHNGHGYEDTTPTHVTELQARMKPWYLRREVGDTGIELPELSRQLIECELTPARIKQHDQILEGIPHDQLLRAIATGQGGQSTLKAISQLRKLVGDAKTKETIEYIASVREQGQHVVCFTWRKATARALAQRFDKTDTVQVVTGDLSANDRELAVEFFQKHGGILFATIDSLKEGVTLTKARVVIIHDLHWTPTAILQAERRIHRIGQNRACMATWMVARGTIDEMFAELLRKKIAAMGEVLGRSMTNADETLEGFGTSGELSDLVRQSILEWRTW